MTGERIDTQGAALLRCAEKLFGQFERELVRRDVVGQVGALRLRLATTVRGDRALEIRTESADPHVHRATLVVVEQPDRVDLTGIDLFEVHADELLEPGTGLSFCTLLPVVETGQPGGAILCALRDLVEIVFEGGREVVVDKAFEVRLEQSHHRERDPGRHEGRPLLVHVPAVLDGADDRRVRRRTPDPQLFQCLHQRGFGVSGGWVGGVPVGTQLGCSE